MKTIKEKLQVPYCTGRDVPFFDMPEKACDTHFHIFDPIHFPYKKDDERNQPPATVDCYRLLMRHLGIERCVIVNPSCYGLDNSCTISAVRQLGDCARGVVVIDKNTSFDLLRQWNEYGIRGIRFNIVSGDEKMMDNARKISEKTAKLGWHTVLYISPDLIVKLKKELQDFPCQIVFDHMLHLSPDTGIKHEAFEIGLDLMNAKKAYVKLSGFYITAKKNDYSDLFAISKAFIEKNPDRLLWGTDWPHHYCYIHQKNMPDDSYMLDSVMASITSQDIIEKILIKNPAKLYGFCD